MVKSWGLEFMIHRFLLLFLLNTKSFLHLKYAICPVLLREYQQINPIAMDSYLFWLFLLSVFLGKGERGTYGKEETSFPAQGAAHSTQMLVCPRLQEEAVSIFAGDLLLNFSTLCFWQLCCLLLLPGPAGASRPGWADPAEVEASVLLLNFLSVFSGPSLSRAGTSLEPWSGKLLCASPSSAINKNPL